MMDTTKTMTEDAILACKKGTFKKMEYHVDIMGYINNWYVKSHIYWL